MRVADEDVDIKVGVDGAAKAEAALKGVSKSIDDTGKSGRRATPPVKKFEKGVSKSAAEARQLAAAAKLAEKNIASMGRQATRTNLKLKALERTQAKLNRTMAKAGVGGAVASVASKAGVPSGGTPSTPSGGGGSSGGSKGGGKSGGKGEGIFGGVAGGSIIAMMSRFGSIAYLVAAIIPALVTGVVALGAGIMGLVGSLAPLSGLLVAYPALLAAVGTGFLAVKMAMAGMGDAMKVWSDYTKTDGEVNAGLARFTGGGINKDVAKPMLQQLGLITNEFTYMGYAVQRTLLPAMTEFVNMGRSYLPMMRQALVQTGSAISDVIAGMSDYLSLSSTQKTVGSILKTNTGLIRSFGTVGSSALNMILKMVDAAGPMLSTMARDLSGFMRSLNGQVNAGASNGGLARFFTSAYAAAKQVLKIINPLIIGLYNVAKIGKPLGDAMLASWGAMADKFRKFTESEAGIVKIAHWFEYMTPIIYELGYLVRDLAIGLGKMSMDDGFLRMAVIIRTELLPVLLDFINNTASAFLPAILKAVEAVVRLITVFQGFSATALLVNTLANGLLVVAKVLDGLGPVIKLAIGLMVAFFMTVKMGSFMLLLFTKLKDSVRNLGATASVTSKQFKILGLSIKGAWASTGIGLLVVGLSFLAEALMGANMGTEDAIDQNKEWAKSLFEVNGALVENHRLVIAEKLLADGLLDAGEKYAISNELIIDAVSGNADAQTVLKEKLQGVIDANTRMVAIRGKMVPQIRGEGLAAKDLMDKLFGLVNATDAEKAALERVARASGTYVDQMDPVTKATNAATIATNNLIAAQQKLAGLFSNRQKTIQRFNNRRAALAALKESKGSVNLRTEKGGQAAAAVDTMMTDSMANAQAAQDAKNIPRAMRWIARGRKDYELALKNVPEAQKADFEKSYADILKQWTIMEKQMTGVSKAERAVRRAQQKKDQANNVGLIRTGINMGQVPAQADPMYGMDRENVTRAGVASGQVPKEALTKFDAPQTAVEKIAASLNTINNTPWGVNMNAEQVTAAYNAALDMFNTATSLTNKTWTIAFATTLNGEPQTGGALPSAPQSGGTGAGGRGKWMGGDVAAGWKGWVGELGPEGFIDRAGKFSIIGAKGPEIKQFSGGGYVVPNHELAGAMAARTSSATSGGSVGEPLGGGLTVHIGTIQQATEFDVIQAVRQGIREAERDRKERS